MRNLRDAGFRWPIRFPSTIDGALLAIIFANGRHQHVRIGDSLFRRAPTSPYSAATQFGNTIS